MRQRVSPAAASALGAGMATACACLVGFAFWTLLPQGSVAAVITAAPFILAPVATAAAAWFSSRRAMRETLDPIVGQIDDLANHQSDAPVAASSMETMPLAAALERYRLVMNERNRSGKVHSAVARLLGAGIGRLADGDVKARISVDLPDAYRAYRDDFNRAMENLEARFAASADATPTLLTRAQEIESAAETLAKRAEKLAQRIGGDLAIIDAALQAEPTDALQLAQHTLGGARVAAQRNMEAAESFRQIARQLAADSTRFDNPSLETVHDAEETEATSDHPYRPASIGNAALKTDI